MSTRPDQEVSDSERRYSGGVEPMLLDLIDLHVLEPRPEGCQTENWLLDPEKNWHRVGRAPWALLDSCVENPPVIWVNGHHTKKGVNDEIPLDLADGLRGSLHFILVPRVDLRVFVPGREYGNLRRRVQAIFHHGEAQYALRVTDAAIEEQYASREEGLHRLGESYLTISLGEPFQKQNGQLCRYKLVAAIIERGGGTPS